VTIPQCPKCGEPARIVVLTKARVRYQLNPDGSPGTVVSVSRDQNRDQNFECGGGHTWKALKL
jgi:hypothetical protein